MDMIHRIIHKSERIPLITIKSLSQIRVVDYDDVARPDGRYATDGDQKKDS